VIMIDSGKQVLFLKKRTKKLLNLGRGLPGESEAK